MEKGRSKIEVQLRNMNPWVEIVVQVMRDIPRTVDKSQGLITSVGGRPFMGLW